MLNVGGGEKGAGVLSPWLVLLWHSQPILAVATAAIIATASPLLWPWHRFAGSGGEVNILVPSLHWCPAPPPQVTRRRPIVLGQQALRS